MQLIEAQRHSHALAIGLTHYFKAHGNKQASIDWFDPYKFQIARYEATGEIGRRTAKILLDLIPEGEVPNWVIPQIDVDEIRACRDRILWYAPTL